MATAKKPAPVAKKAAPSKSKTAAKSGTPRAKTSATPKNGVAKAAPDPGKVLKGGSQSVKDEFANFKDKASDSARAAADRGKERASEALDGIGKLLRDSAGTIDEKVGAEYGNYARKAADAVEGFADKMDAKQVDDLVEDARQFVRKSPAVAIGAAAAIGFVLARIVRSGRDA